MTPDSRNEPLPPEWPDANDDVDDASFAASIEAARRRHFAELADL